MKKIISLIRASMSSGMNIFRIKTKNNSSKKLMIVFVSFALMFSFWSYANVLLEQLDKVGLEYVALSLFVIITAVFTLIEGIYKSGSLMFNCKDDDLLLSLPIERRTILFVRLFKFYIFEVMFNSLFFVPVIIAYLRWVTVDISFIVTSLVMILFLPIIPIIISSMIGSITTSLSSRFKYKNLTEIVLSILVLGICMFLSFNMDSFIENIASNAKSINDFITKIYYPAGLYGELAVNFNIYKLLIFILVNLGLLVVTIYMFSLFYFKINSRIKTVITKASKSSGKISILRKKSQTKALIGKEFSFFFNTPVFLVNAGFSLAMYVIVAVGIILKYDYIVSSIKASDISTLDMLLKNFVTYNFLFIIIVSLTTSITSSMISLEGKNINIIKSLPVSTEKVLKSKIYTSLIIMLPLIILGNILISFKLKYSIFEFLLLLIAALVFSTFSSLLGLIINLKFPKLDFENSAEVVKQSISSFLAVAIGFFVSIVAYFGISYFINAQINSLMIIIFGIIIGIIFDVIMYYYLMKNGTRQFRILNI